jgi:hypothetical protein
MTCKEEKQTKFEYAFYRKEEDMGQECEKKENKAFSLVSSLKCRIARCRKIEDEK